jgi:uroporphyrinogen-III synthase
VGETEQSAHGLLEVWPPFDAMLDPINRVFLPRADIATETLVAGLQNLGWEVDDVTAYRTVRAAPPPAEIREAIKTGQFDAVVFTSSSTVRNLVGIAVPHTRTVVSVIGPKTADTAVEFDCASTCSPRTRPYRIWSRRLPRTRWSCVRSSPRCRPSSCGSKAGPDCAEIPLTP